MKRKIAIIIQKLNFGGAGRCASNISIDLSGIFDTHLIVFDGSNQMYPHGGVLHDLKIPGTSNKIKKVLNVVRRTLMLRSIKKKNRFDCSISLLTGANYVNVQSSIGEKTIVSIRNNMSLSRLSSKEDKMVRESCKQADCVVALSESVRRDMILNYGVPAEKVVTIYNSCDAKRLAKLAGETNRDLEIQGDYIVTMGRLMPQKGQWHLIRAFKEVQKNYPHLKLVILGEGEDEFAEGLKKLVKNLDLQENVIFPGYIKNPHQIIGQSKMFVFTSLYEGLGNVLLEALACNRAIISTDCIAGPREILAPGTDIEITEKGALKEIAFEKYGVLVPAFDQSMDVSGTQITNDEKKLAKAICILYGNSEIREEYERKAAERIEDFSPAKIASNWEELINQLCEEK